MGIYLQEAIKSLTAHDREQPSRSGQPEWTGGEASIEFKARQLSLNFDSGANTFYLQAHESEEEQGEEGEEISSISCWVTIGQAEPLAAEALRICASGRPNCFLCGLPINADGHVCPRANGHAVFESG